MHQEMKNDAEIRVECQEQNYSNWSISCSNIKIQFCIISWRLKEIRKTDRKTRKKQTMYKNSF